jgi:hypothetical protein
MIKGGNNKRNNMIIILIMIKGAIKYLTYFLGFVSKVTKTS